MNKSIRLVAVVVFTVCLSVSLLAALSIEYFANEGPLTATVTTNATGSLSVQAWFQGRSATVELVGPASCENSSTRRYTSVGCFIADAPPGVYQLTVRSRTSQPITAVYAVVMGEISVPVP